MTVYFKRVWNDENGNFSYTAQNDNNLSHKYLSWSFVFRENEEHFSDIRLWKLKFIQITFQQ